MHGSACRWRIFQNAKIFEVTLFLKSPACERYRFSIGVRKQVFIKLPIVFLTETIKQNF